ncbi:hypothetical protein MERGE_001994 [Pneumocystis wakefieldiae]|uniref:Thioredoxin domain-containing protein n=1 Tax=Pneumocystis wakefieldiae TaxID=38082 RepID=A0A899FXE6_9ASCO|nr:hypothetical protein MERGE_001994 [Pneumocystis wakefieldiae]
MGEGFSILFSKIPNLSSLKDEERVGGANGDKYLWGEPYLTLEEPFWLETVKRASNDNRDNLYFGSVDCYIYKKLCSELGIEHYPKVLVFENGKPREEFMLGNMWEGNLNQIKAHVKKKTEEISLSETSKKILRSSIDDLSLKSTLKKYTHNPHGKSISLTPQTFPRLIRTGSTWFIKYYLPNCPYCKSMEGDWIKFAGYMKGLMNVGEVDCSKYGAFCKKMGVSYVPFLLYYAGAHSIRYSGPRKASNFKDFSRKLLLSRHSHVQKHDTFLKYSSRFPTFFIYFYKQLTLEDIVIISIILRHKYWQDFLDWMSIVLIGKAPLIKIPNSVSFIKEPHTSSPILFSNREGILFPYFLRDPNHSINKTRIYEWIESSLLSLFPQLTRHNHKRIMSHDFVVLIILYNINEYKTKKQEVKDAIYTWKTRYSSNFVNKRSNQPYSIQYAWVDGKLFKDWLYRTFGIRYGQTKVIIKKRDIFWHKNIDGSYIQPNKRDILRTLYAVMQDTNKIKPTHLPRKTISEPRTKKTYYYVAIIVFIVVVTLLMIFLAFILKKVKDKKNKENDKNDERLESRFE